MKKLLLDLKIIMKTILSSGMNRTSVLLVLMVAGWLPLQGCVDRDSEHQQAYLNSDNQPSFPLVEPDSSHQLKEFFSSLDYDWSTLDQGIPPFFLGKFPEDLDGLKEVAERKRLFFLGLAPMIIFQNQTIMLQRMTLLGSFRKWDQGRTLPAELRAWIAEIAGEYKIDGNPLIDRKARRLLLKRVDLIPPSLALAQAASESAYGTSRFSRQGNNLFGEWTYVQGTGLIPENRTPGLTHEVRKFPTLLDSVKSYMANLNTNSAYIPFRDKRALLRAKGLPPTGPILTDGLLLYSERGVDYTREIASIIQHNGLLRFTNSALRSDHPPGATEPDALGAGLFSSRLFASRQSVLTSRRIDP